MLSTAFTIKSRPFQKVSLKTFSLSLDYLSSIGSILRSLFISIPILADTAAFDDFT